MFNQINFLMQDLNELLATLEEKYGNPELSIQCEEGCSTCLYDDDCISCKGNAMGN